MQCVAVCCSVLQCVAVYCSVLQCVVVCCRSISVVYRGILLLAGARCSVLQHVAVWFIALQGIAVCCSVLQCDAVCCSMLQWMNANVVIKFQSVMRLCTPQEFDLRINTLNPKNTKLLRKRYLKFYSRDAAAQSQKDATKQGRQDRLLNVFCFWEDFFSFRVKGLGLRPNVAAQQAHTPIPSLCNNPYEHDGNV